MSLHETVLPMFKTSMYFWIGSPISLKSAFDISFDNVATHCSEHKVKANYVTYKPHPKSNLMFVT